jgi:hypothetical protein
MYPSVLRTLREFLGEFEGVRNYMYPDQVSKITTGVGFNIDLPARAHLLTWHSGSPTGPVAARNAVSTEMDNIRARQRPTLFLAPEEIERFFRAEADRFDGELNNIFWHFYQSPADAQVAMMAHAWANGTGRLKTAWPHYHAACMERHWLDARREFPWQLMAPRRRTGMGVMFHNAYFVDLETPGAAPRYNHTVVYYPVQLAGPTSDPRPMAWER